MKNTQYALAVSTCLLLSLLHGTMAEAQNTLRLMGWNIRGSTFNQAESSIIRFLLDSGADIIALQEVGNSVGSLMADPALGSQYTFYQTSNDNPLLVRTSLSLGVSNAQPSGVGLCSEGIMATIELPSGGGSFALFNNHFCFDTRNRTDGQDLLDTATPANNPQRIVALGDLNTSTGFNPDTLSDLLNGGFIDTWALTSNPLPKRDVEWILVNPALVAGALVLSTSDDNSCVAATNDGRCSDHRAFLVDIEFGSDGGGCPVPVGDPTFCRDCGPCSSGEGDCDNNAECASGLTCVNNVGADFGFAPGIDVCLADGGGNCPWPPGHPAFCRDCGPCSDGEGDCDNNAECAAALTCVDNVGADFGFAPGIDVCLADGGGNCPWPPGHPAFCRDCGPCSDGEGDCDNNAECAAGLTCVDNVGADFGFAPGIDVCLADGGGCAVPVGHPTFCRNCGPCSSGEGDCDNNAECASGLTCVDNVGADFGFAPGIDVCL